MKSLMIMLIAVMAFSIQSCSEKESVNPASPIKKEVKKNEKKGDNTTRNDKSGGEDDDPRPIRGIIKSVDGTPLANVATDLYDDQSNLVDETQTNSNGVYQIDDVSPGDYELHFELTGYHLLIENITVAGPDSVFIVGIDTLIAE